MFGTRGGEIVVHANEQVVGEVLGVGLFEVVANDAPVGGFDGLVCFSITNGVYLLGVVQFWDFHLNRIQYQKTPPIISVFYGWWSAGRFTCFNYYYKHIAMSESENKIVVLPSTDEPQLTVEETKSLEQYYQDARAQIGESWQWAHSHVRDLSDWDERFSRNITAFKRDHILPIGDLINRSICMAVAGGLTYKLISFNNPSIVRRTRNLAVSFLLNGWLFVPELFNPFLPKSE